MDFESRFPDLKTQKKILILCLISVFLSMAAFFTYNALNVQGEMVSEIDVLQQNLNEQKEAISTVVRILEEEREEKKKLQHVKDTLQTTLQMVAIQMDSLQKTLNRREKALHNARKKAKILEEQIPDKIYISPFRLTSPLELRFRSTGETEFQSD